MKSKLRRMPVGQDDLPDLFRDEIPDETPEDTPDDQDHTPLKIDDESWDAFLPDDQPDPLPEPGDFWIESDQLNEHLLAA